MDDTYQFEAHLREHRPSRLGQRLWWIPAAVGVGVVIAEGVYLGTTVSGRLSAVLGGALPCIAALLFLLAWAALSIAEWTYPREKYYREVQHVAASQLRAYVLAGRRSRASAPPRKYDHRSAHDDFAIRAVDLRGDATPETAPASVATE
ncbi:MAG TPA: hypothetical protein VJU80_00135 [Solirubrobacteraceae bacterium]|nr:hypothetical protein [Solirubrobacteraceae bacterium]